MPLAGQFIKASDVLADTLSSYTPTWGSSGTAPAIGNGILEGQYLFIAAKLVWVTIHFKAGSTSTFGTGFYNFSLPPGVTVNAVHHYLAGFLFDSSAGDTGNYVCGGRAAANGTTVDRCYVQANRVGATAPMTFAVNDEIGLSGVFGIA